MKKAACTILALLLQIAVVGWLIYRYENIVRNGTEVRFACKAYDPYDPLRGRFLRISARETCTNLLMRTGTGNSTWRPGGNIKVFAKLEPSSNGLWQVAAVAESIPENEKTSGEKPLWVKFDNAYIRYSLDWDDKEKNEDDAAFMERRAKSGFKAFINQPGEYFVNEHIAPVAEKELFKALTNENKSVTAVYRANETGMVISGILIDGKSIIDIVRENNVRKDASKSTEQSPFENTDGKLK